jgi:ribosomal protein L3 glutamine methyltransferase
LILCNPPYVNAASMAALPPEYRAEPALALAGGADGMDFIGALLRDLRAPRATRNAGPTPALSSHGVLVLEIGHERAHFEAAFPGLPVNWLATSAGEDQVLLVTAEELELCG